MLSWSQYRLPSLIGIAVVTLAMVMFAFVGCERVPDYVMDSPPAKYRAPVPSPAPLKLDDETPREPSRPRDRVASIREVEVIAVRPATEIEQAELNRIARDAFARMGEPSVPLLIAELQVDDVDRRRQAADLLARIGPEAVAAAEPLVERLEDQAEQPEVKLACAKALGQMGPALWPDEPVVFLEPPTLEPLTDVEEAADNPELAALQRRRVARRIEYQDSGEKRRQQYYDQLQEYQRRNLIARRAVDALAALAISQ